ncbi:MAG TPA: hypothetical protein VKV37_07215 [Ktedonobacteraceae bacterium]|jgi:hypothetical protein|nr:hypothetical protein [Ktedonobacteraceae bacterium]
MSKKDKNGAQEIDEHDLPTEPVPFPATPPGAQQMTPAGTMAPYDNTAPGAPPYGQPFPQQQALVLPQPSWDEPQGDKIYPPPAPPGPPLARRRGKKNRQPAAPVQPVYPVYPAYPAYPAQPVYTNQPGRRMGTRHSPVPALTKLFFRLVQLLLLARILLKLAEITGLYTSTAAWVGIVYALSDAFIAPVRLLWLQVHIPFTVGPEIYALLGIVLYGLFARILVGILRMILR